MTVPSPSITIGTLKPNSDMLSATYYTASSFLRGLRSYGLRSFTLFVIISMLSPEFLKRCRRLSDNRITTDNQLCPAVLRATDRPPSLRFLFHRQVSLSAFKAFGGRARSQTAPPGSLAPEITVFCHTKALLLNPPQGEAGERSRFSAPASGGNW